MKKITGYAKLRGNTLYFDDTAWKLILKTAKKQHKTPKQIVTGALKRYAKTKAL